MIQYDKKLLTTEEVAEILRCSDRTVFTLKESGKIAFVRIGRLVRFPEKAVQEYLDRNTVASRINMQPSMN